MKKTVSEIEKACDILRSGGVIGMPTETVYGLAASIQSISGLENIFKTKERPFFDPLIVHVNSISQARSLTSDWNKTCQKIADIFWPGPLTLILDKSPEVNDLITSGLTTVGIRFPSHPKALELIGELGHPVAAPSANKFKKISPTTAEHVRNEFPDILVLEGGQSDVGIESTIIRVQNGELIIYRPGMITEKELKEKLGSDFKVSLKESPIAPGHLAEHYRPIKPLILKLESENIDSPYQSPLTWIVPSQATLAARQLYSKLRELDQRDGDCIEVLITEEMTQDDQFRGILNRLYKAASLKSNRIKSEY